jgi:hypothetical protein
MTYRSLRVFALGSNVRLEQRLAGLSVPRSVVVVCGPGSPDRLTITATQARLRDAVYSSYSPLKYQQTSGLLSCELYWCHIAAAGPCQAGHQQEQR